MISFKSWFLWIFEKNKTKNIKNNLVAFIIIITFLNVLNTVLIFLHTRDVSVNSNVEEKPFNNHNVQFLFSFSLGFIFCLLCILPTLLLLPLLLLLLLIYSPCSPFALHSSCMMGSSAAQIFCMFSNVFFQCPEFTCISFSLNPKQCHWY